MPFSTYAVQNGDSGGIRTHDPMIKSHVLYRLSYGIIPAKWRAP